MDRIGDDELHYIFNKIPYHRRSLIQVSKRFMKVACADLEFLHSYVPDMLFDIIPSSPNLRSFLCWKPLSNNHLKLLAHSCPKLELLDLNLLHVPFSQQPAEFDDDGFSALVNSCSHLKVLHLCRRLHVGDAGIVSLVTSSNNLIELNLQGCIRVTDESLKAIGKSGRGIRYLNLRGCYMITDLGLEYLASGDLKYSLKELNLSECDKISDNAAIHLKQMVGLAQLNLSKCGVRVTDSLVVALISQLPNIQILDLSWLINVTNTSLLAIGSKCLKLERICLTGCEAITAEGLHAFSGHRTLETLVLFSCYNFSWEDVQSVLVTCRCLKYLGLMKSINTSMPGSSFPYYLLNCSIIWM